MNTDESQTGTTTTATRARMVRVPAVGEPQPFGDRWPQLSELQAWVGGFVEHLVVRVMHDEMHLLVHDDAKRLGLPVNVVASALYASQFNPPEVRAAIARDPSTAHALTICGNAWLWHGPLPADT